MDALSVWSMFYSGLVAFQYHPGCKNPISLDELAEVADLMLQQAEKRFVIWRGSQQQPR